MRFKTHCRLFIIFLLLRVSH